MSTSQTLRCFNRQVGTLQNILHSLVFRAVAGTIILVYVALLYGVLVPDWEFILPSSSEALHACSVNSPDYGPLPVDSPDWCRAPFDPEGLLSSVSAIGSCFLGLHFGHHHKEHAPRLRDWTVTSLALLATGFFFHLVGTPFNKPLYSVSYMLFTGGASGIVLIGF